MLSLRIALIAAIVSVGAHAQLIIASGNTGSQQFTQYTLPHIDGVLKRYSWATMEPSSGRYNFSAIDADSQAWAAKGKKLAIIVTLATDDPQAQGSHDTPQWVLNQGVPIAKCKFVPSGVPVLYSAPAMAASKAFLVALLQHLRGNKAIAYVRAGFFEGGENCPLCRDTLPGATIDGKVFKTYGPDLLSAYVSSMATTMIEAKSGIQLDANCNGCAENSDADAEGEIFAMDGIGIGSEALSANDAFPCVDDWCKLFKQFPRYFKHLQPAVNQPPTAFPLYVGTAKSYGVNALELFVPDLDIAYNPKNPLYVKYGASYRTAIGK